jgi:hypothetical protein
MGARSAVAAGTVTSVAVTAAWSWTATLTISTPAGPRLTGNLPGDYTQLAAAATGSSPWALFGAVAVTCALCFLASGLRARRRARREAARDLDLEFGEDAEADPALGGYR